MCSWQGGEEGYGRALVAGVLLVVPEVPGSGRNSALKGPWCCRVQLCGGQLG